MRSKLLLAGLFVVLCTMFVLAQQRVMPIQPTGSMNHAVLDNLPADANKGATRTTSPIPSGCEATSTFIANNQMGVLRCNPADLGLIVEGPGIAGTPSGSILTVQGILGATPLVMGFYGVPATGLQAVIGCDQYVFDRSSTADVQLYPSNTGERVWVCGYTITGEATTGSDVNLRTATSTNCTTGATNLTPPITVGTSTSGGMIGGVSIGNQTISPAMFAPFGQNLCVHRSAAQVSEVQVWLTRRP